MTEIEFDKLCNVVCRIWTMLFSKSGLTVLDEIESVPPSEVQKLVLFQPPLQEIPGLHGPGEARTQGSETHYLVDILKTLDDEGVGYFLFRPSARRNVPDGGMKCVQPALLTSDDPTFWEGFTTAEIQHIRQMSGAISRLTAEQIRALGTHRTAFDTVEDVRREFRWARDRARQIMGTLNAGLIEFSAALRLQTCIREAGRKAKLNVAAYAEAYAGMSLELGGTILEAFKSAQTSPEAMWSSPELPSLIEKAADVDGISNCVLAVAFFLEHAEDRVNPKTREGRRMQKMWDEGRASVQSRHRTTLSEHVAEVIEGNRLTNDASRILRKLLQKI